MKVLISEDGGEEYESILPEAAEKFGFDHDEIKSHILTQGNNRTATVNDNVVIRADPSVPMMMSAGGMGASRPRAPADPSAATRPEDAKVDLSSAGDKGRALEQGIEDINEGLANMKDLDGAKQVAETVNFFADEVAELELESLGGLPKAAVRTFTSRFIDASKIKIEEVTDSEMSGVLKPAFETLFEKFSPLVK